ncbi:metal ABC transporter substrate-binding protein [Rhodocyclaceae bacterium SMB388]
MIKIPPLFKTFLLILALGLNATTLSARSEPLTVVTSFSILGDLARQIGGDDIRVISLIGPDEDAHGYQPRPSDSRLIGEAGLVIVNGLGFDTWLERVASSTGRSGRVVIVSEGIDAIENAYGQAHAGHDHGPGDPHAWQDVANARVYARNIARAFAQADPSRADVYRRRAEAYDQALAALDAEIRSTLSVLPASRRKLVTSHDAFAYFGRAYGIVVIAAAGISHESEPSAAGIARLIRQLRREKAPVVFVENISDPRLIERIAREGSAGLGGKLYSDALSGPDGPAGTYIAMMRFNLAQLMDGLMSEAALEEDESGP